MCDWYRITHGGDNLNRFVNVELSSLSTQTITSVQRHYVLQYQLASHAVTLSAFSRKAHIRANDGEKPRHIAFPSIVWPSSSSLADQTIAQCSHCVYSLYTQLLLLSLLPSSRLWFFFIVGLWLFVCLVFFCCCDATRLFSNGEDFFFGLKHCCTMKELNTDDVLFSVLNALNGYILFGIQLKMYGKLSSILIPEEHLTYT